MSIFSQIVHLHAHELGLYGRVAWEKSCLDKASRTKRLNYVKTYQDKGKAFRKSRLIVR